MTAYNKYSPFQQRRKYFGGMLALLVLAIVFGIAAASFTPRSIQAAPALPSPANEAVKSYDPIVMTLSDSFLQTNLIRNSHNAVAEYQLLLRAGYQHHEKVAYQTMNQLRQEQPNNAIVLDGYFMALKMAEGSMGSIRYNGAYSTLKLNQADDEEADALLQKAYQLSPKLWLTYAVEGEEKFYNPVGSPNQGMALLQKAERLAPEVPYVHWLLGDAYTVSPNSPQKFRLSIA